MGTPGCLLPPPKSLKDQAQDPGYTRDPGVHGARESRQGAHPSLRAYPNGAPGAKKSATAASRHGMACQGSFLPRLLLYATQ